jgi:hypothetical protein
MTIKEHGDPAVVTFFNEVVAEAFEAIKINYLKGPTLSRARIYPGLAELLIYYDPKRSYKWFFYRLQVREEALWRKSFHKNQMNETPSSDKALVRYDYTITTVDHIISDFVSQYRDDWATKPLGEPPSN